MANDFWCHSCYNRLPEYTAELSTYIRFILDLFTRSFIDANDRLM